MALIFWFLFSSPSLSLSFSPCLSPSLSLHLFPSFPFPFLSFPLLHCFHVELKGGEFSGNKKVGKSVDHPDVPCTFGVKRGTVYSSGYHLMPISKDKTRVTYISHVDLGDNLPKQVRKVIEINQPLLLHELNQFINTNPQLFSPRFVRKRK